jgi:ligand-binding sensor domain-containing protein
MKKSLIVLLLFAGLNVFLFAQQNPYYKFYFNGNDITSIVPVYGNSIFLFGSREAGIGAFNLDSMKYVGIVQKLYLQFPSHNIRNIKKFSNDTIWICTDRGLVRYRSNEILIYNTNNSPLPSNIVNDIYRDVLGGLWIATANGLAYKYDTTWTIYNTSNSGIPDDYVITVKIDPLGNIWVGTPNGIGMFDRNEWYVWNTENSGLPDNYISFIEFDNFNNSKWIGTLHGGLVHWIGDNFNVFDTTNSPLPSNMVTCFAFDTSRNRWIGTNKGVAFVSQNGWRIFNTSNSRISDDFINTIFIDGRNRKFFGTRNKVSVLDDINFIVIDFTNSKLPTNYVVKVVEGKDLVKWIATPSALVSFDSNNWQVFDSSNSPIKSNINDINIDNENNLWVATDFGLFVKNGNDWTEYYYDTINLPSNRILRVLPTESGVYVGTDSGLVVKTYSRWIRLDTMYGDKLKGMISSLSKVKVLDKFGIWIDKVYAGLAERGIAVFFDRDSVWFIDEGNSPLVNMYITDVAEDKNGKLFVGTSEQGLFTYDSVWTVHNPATGDFPDFNVVDIDIDKKNTAWMTSFNGGIAVWKDTTRFILTEDNSPFYTNNFNNVFTDLSNNKWISTAFGLYVFNEDTIKPELKFKRFDKSVCMGNPFLVDFYTFYLFEPGNTFIVLLSDSLGSFDSAYVVGRKQGRVAEPILCVAPRNISPGYTYQLRIVSTNPPLVADFEEYKDHLGIIEVPHPKIIGDTVVCSGNVVKLWAFPKREGMWDLRNDFFWRVEGGTLLSLPTDDTVFVRFDTVTSGKVILTAINELGCQDSTFVMINVSQPPGRIINGQTRVCSGQSFIYSTTDSSQIKNIWSVQNGTLEKKLADNVVIIKWDNTTPGYVILKRINQFGCVDSVKLKVDIFHTPEATISGKKEVMFESIEKYVTTRTDMTVSNKWSVTNGLIVGRDDGDTVVVGWNKAGFGKVKLLQRTPAGCYDSSEMVVRIFEYLKVDGDTLVCENNETYFEAVSNLGANNSWSVQGGTITSNPTNRRVWIKWGSAGTGSVKLVQWFPNTFFKDSIVQRVKIAKFPEKPVIADSGGYLYSSAPYGNQWYFNGKILPGDTNRTIVPLRTGYYTVRVTTAPGCESELSEPFYFVSGVEDETESIRIYPNPASNFVEFVTTGENGISEILIRDLTGSEVMRFDFNVPVYKKSLDISNILNGTYIVEVVVGNHRVARRLVVLR